MGFAGVGIATAGGVIASGAIVIEAVLKKLGIKSIEGDLQMDYFRAQQINVILCRASIDVSLANKWISHDIANLGGFVGKLAKIGVTVVGGALTVGARTVSRTIALGAGRTAAFTGLHIAGLTLAAAMIPIDLWLMITSSIKVHKKQPSLIVEEMQHISNKLEEELNKYLQNEN